jgi:hypothetical protein
MIETIGGGLMTKNKKVVHIIEIGLIVTLLFFIFGTPNYQSIKIKSEGFADLQEKLKRASVSTSEIDINKLTNFLWDDCYVFTPYYPSKLAYKNVGTEWTNAKTFIGFLMSHNWENETVNDEDFLIVFKKDKKVVLAKRYSINQLPVIFKLDNYKFTRNNAKFLVKDSKLYDGKIKELVLKN